MTTLWPLGTDHLVTTWPLCDHLALTTWWPLYKSFFSIVNSVSGPLASTPISKLRLQILKSQRSNRLVGVAGPSGPGLLKGTFFLSITSLKSSFSLVIDWIHIDWATLSYFSAMLQNQNIKQTSRRKWAWNNQYFFQLSGKCPQKLIFGKLLCASNDKCWRN